MAARQFGFVVCRGLAVLTLLFLLNQVYFIYGSVMMVQSSSDSLTKPIGIGLLVAYILLATFLWVSANQFSGPQDDAQPSIRAGNWVVRLVFTSLGSLIMLSAFYGIGQGVMGLTMPQEIPYAFTREQKLDFGLSIVRFLIGLGLFIAYRFDKAAALQAAQAIEKS